MHFKTHQMTMIPHHHTYFATKRASDPGGEGGICTPNGE